MNMIDQRLVSLPKRLQDISKTDVWDFVNNLWTEDREAGFSASDREYLWNPKSGSGIIIHRVAYYKQSYVCPLVRAVHYSFDHTERPRILDVCCGTGTQAILFALLGADVVGLDYSESQLEVMRKRVVYYQQWFGEFGTIQVMQGDMRSEQIAQWGPFDTIYSHYGVGYHLKADELLGFYGMYIKPGGYLILKNPNAQCLAARLFGKIHGSTRAEYLAAARRHGFQPRELRFLTAIPRSAWSLGALTHVPDSILRQIPSLGIHLEVVMQRI